MGGVDREGAQGRLRGAVNVLYLDLGGGYMGVFIWKTAIKLFISEMCPLCTLYINMKVYKKFIELLLFARH